MLPASRVYQRGLARLGCERLSLLSVFDMQGSRRVLTKNTTLGLTMLLRRSSSLHSLHSGTTKLL